MESLRSLPKVDVLAASPELAHLPERVRIRAAQVAIEKARAQLLSGSAAGDLLKDALHWAAQNAVPSLGNCINLSGVILHTGLGRARLAPSVAQRVGEVAAAHSAFEFDLESGTRGDRQSHVRDLLRMLTGAEDALVVNNAAGAVLLSLAALCVGKEVLLSRGQMVEIGGAFRMPDVIRQSGCKLVEIGCTNKTHLRDYQAALRLETAAILRCHPSNFRIVGFVGEPSLGELAHLAHLHQIKCIDDMGTGCLADFSRWGLKKIWTIRDSIDAGADLVIGSGDKLLGGPQAGIIVGSTEAIRAVEAHPLARALRVDKLTLAALEATLRLYSEGRELEIPALGYAARSLEQVAELAAELADACSGEVAPGVTEMGAGCAPGTEIPSWRVAVPGNAMSNAARLRGMPIPIVGRIERERFWLDPRTLDEQELTTVTASLRSL